MKFIPWTFDRMEELVELWNRELDASFPMRLELFIQNSILDTNICDKASLLAIDDTGQIIGFIIAKRWKEVLNVPMRNDVGWIQVLIVDKNYRRQNIGSTLLTHAESEFEKNGLKEILLGKDPWHYFPGIPSQFTEVKAWFEQKGYVSFGEEHDLVCHYESKSTGRLPVVKEAEFSLVELKDKDEFLAFLQRCFPGRWEYEAIHYFKKGGTGREFVVLKKHGQIIGFSRVNDANSPLIAQNMYWSPLFTEELGGIGPLGIDEAERGNGYGIAIVEAAISTLRNRDIHMIVIDWTALVGFYTKIGYEVWKSYDSFRKVI